MCHVELVLTCRGEGWWAEVNTSQPLHRYVHRCKLPQGSAQPSMEHLRVDMCRSSMLDLQPLGMEWQDAQACLAGALVEASNHSTPLIVAESVLCLFQAPHTVVCMKGYAVCHSVVTAHVAFFSIRCSAGFKRCMMAGRAINLPQMGTRCMQTAFARLLPRWHSSQQADLGGAGMQVRAAAQAAWLLLLATVAMLLGLSQ